MSRTFPCAKQLRERHGLPPSSLMSPAPVSGEASPASRTRRPGAGRTAPGRTAPRTPPATAAPRGSTSAQSTSRNGSPASHAARGRILHDRVGLVAREPALDQRQQHALREDQPAGRVQVLAHAVREHTQPVDDPLDERQHVVDRDRRVGQDHALHARSARCPARATAPRPPARPAGSPAPPGPARRCARTGSDCACAAWRTSPSVPPTNGSSTSRTSVRARWRISVAIFSSVAAVSASAQHELRVHVALHDLAGGLGRPQAELAADELLDTGIDLRVRPDHARQLADRRRPRAPVAGGRGRGPARTPTAPACGRTSLVRRGRRACARCRSCPGARAPGRRTTASSALEPPQHDVGGVAHLQRQGRVQQVAGGEPEVQPPAGLVPDRLGHRLHERRHVVVRDRLDLRDALRRRRDRRRSRIARASSSGICPMRAQPSTARTSMRSQCASFVSSDQTDGHLWECVPGDHAGITRAFLRRAIP